MPIIEGTYKTSLIGSIRTLMSGLSGFDTMALELIQNADDAKAEKMCFDITQKALIVSNNSVFNYCGNIQSDKCTKISNGSSCDFHRIVELQSGNKSKDSDNIGRFGIGFISTYQITDRPTIKSSGLSLTLIPEKASFTADQSNTKETIFELPWAKDEKSNLRLALEQGGIDNNKIDRIYTDLEKALNQSLLFLKNIKSIELKRDGVSRLIVKKSSKTHQKNELITITSYPEKIKEKWIILKSELEKQTLNEIYEEWPILRAAQRKTKIQIAIKIDKKPIEKGLLFAYLPTQQRSHLPLHIQADFFPDLSRKYIAFSGVSKEDRWNNALMKRASELISEKLDTLNSHIDHKQLFSIVVASFKAQEEESPYHFFWSDILEKSNNAKLIFSSRGDYESANDIVIEQGLSARRHVKKSSIDAFYKTGGRLVSKDLLTLSNDSIDTLKALGVDELNTSRFCEILHNCDEFSDSKLDTKTKPSKLQDTYKPLWEYASYLIERFGFDDSIKSLNFILTTSLTIKSINGVYRSPKFIKNKRLFELFSADFFAHDELEKFNKLHKSIDVFKLSSLNDELIELSSENSLEEFIPSNLSELKAFYEMISELHVTGDEKGNLFDQLKSLSIWRTNTGFDQLDGVLLPGDFEDPTGVAPFLHPKILTKKFERFLEKKLDIQRQTIEAYIEFILPKFFNDDGPLDIGMYQKLMGIFSNRKNLLKDENTFSLLSNTQLIPTKSNTWKKPHEVYFHNKKLEELVGDHSDYWVDQNKLSNTLSINKFIVDLGVSTNPSPEHLLNHFMDLTSNNPPTKSIVKVCTNIFKKLCELYEIHEDKQGEIIDLFDEFTYDEPCFPVIGDDDNWYNSDEVYISNYKSIKHSSAKLLAFNINHNESSKEILSNISISEIELNHIIEHLNVCIDQKYKIDHEVFAILNSEFQSISPAVIENNTSVPSIYDSQKNKLNALSQLCAFPIIFNKEIKKHLRPNQLFFKNEFPNKYTFSIPNELTKYEDLLKTIGVKNKPVADDYIYILTDNIIDQDPDRATYIDCMNYLSENISDANENLLEDLANMNCVLNHFGEFGAINSMFIDDSEWLKGYFSTTDESLNWLTSIEANWLALEKLGLKRLSNSVELKISYITGDEKIETSTLKTLQERLDLFIRVLDNKPKDVVNKLISCIQNLKVKSFDSLKVQAIIDNGTINFNSLEKPESSYFDPKNNELILTRPISKTYVKILKPILYSLIPKSDDNELRSLLSTFDSICDKDYLEAESYLDDLNFKQREEIETDEPIQPLSGYEYIPDEIQNDGSDEKVDFTEESYDYNQDSEKQPADDSLETHRSMGEVNDLPDSVSISKNGKSNSQDKGNDHEKERRNPREFKNNGDSPGQQGSKGKPNKSSHQSTEKTVAYTENKSDKNDHEKKGNNDVNLDIEVKSRAIAVAHEKKSGRGVKEMPQTQPGFDLISFDKETAEELRYIEVKGTKSKWGDRGVSVSYTQFSNAQDQGDKSWLYIVDDVYGESPRLYRIQNFAMRTNTFKYDSGWINLIEQDDELADYGPGVRIDHQVEGFGKGTILSIDKSGLITKLRIEYDNGSIFTKALNKTMKVVKDQE